MAKSVAIMANWVGHEQESMYGHRFYSGTQHFFSGSLVFQSYFGGTEKHKYNAGITFMYDNLNESFNKVGPSLPEYYTPQIDVPNGSRVERVPGAFFQYTCNMNDIFTVIAGLRGDYHNTYGGIVTSRLHIRYNITGQTVLRASAGNGYRTPDIMAEYNPLLASSRRMIFTGNREQEKGWNWGANLTQYIPVGEREASINIEYYRTHFVNQLVVDLDKSVRELRFYNLEGKSFSNVFQAEANVEVIRGWEIVAAWRLNDVKTTTAGILQQKALQSRYKGLLSTSYATRFKKWQFDFTTQFHGGGRVPDTAANVDEKYIRPDKFDPYQIFNAQITKRYKGWSFYFGSENIANFVQHNPIIDAENPFGEYFDTSLIWGPLRGRKFYFGFRIKII
jgi:outer membrane cobalamin receptor